MCENERKKLSCGQTSKTPLHLLNMLLYISSYPFISIRKSAVEETTRFGALLTSDRRQPVPARFRDVTSTARTCDVSGYPNFVVFKVGEEHE